MLLRFLRGIAGGAPKPGLVESRRRFFRHLKARLRQRIFETVDAVGAANHAEILDGRESR